MSKPILCVDFDGVVHSYTSPWQGPAIIPDPPVPGALRWLWKACEWFDVRIYSTRSKDFEGLKAMLAWTIEHSRVEFGDEHPMARPTTDAGEPRYPIQFCHEKPPAFLTIDDRALTFTGDWNDFDPADLLNFKPWNRR